jgi:uncharacterized protein (DUF2147 family)
MMLKQTIVRSKLSDLPIQFVPIVRNLRKFLMMTCSLFWIRSVDAQSSPIGVWRTFDDGSNVPRADIEIYSAGDKLAGKILKLLPSNKQGRLAACSKCSDDRKDRPMIGLEIMRDIPKASADLIWKGGNVLDPDSGKIYKLRLELVDEGKRLRVRGYLGPFYSTETWERIKTSE